MPRAATTHVVGGLLGRRSWQEEAGLTLSDFTRALRVISRLGHWLSTRFALEPNPRGVCKWSWSLRKPVALQGGAVWLGVCTRLPPWYSLWREPGVIWWTHRRGVNTYVNEINGGRG